MAKICIQIVEGNPHLKSLLGWHLQQIGYAICHAATLQQARDEFRQHNPNLIVLGSDLPDGDSLDYCRWLQEFKHPLVMILSARTNETDIVAGLNSGADDYLRKPFGIQEFLARIQALLRRHERSRAPAHLDYGSLRIDLIQRRAFCQGTPVELTPQEFSLLYALAQADGDPLSRSEILRRAWPDSIDNPRTVDTHVLSLRKKIETNPRQPRTIQTVRSVGYRLNVEALKQDGIPIPPAHQTSKIPVSSS